MNSWLVAPMDSATARHWDVLAWLVLGLTFVAVLATFRDYGVAWDEQGEVAEGELLLKYYTSGLHDRSAFEFVNFRYYGGGFELPAALLARISPFGAYPTRHLLSALLGLIGLAATWRIARRLGGARAGTLAAALLALNPSWYGHTFINARDVPFAAGMSCCLLFSLRMLDEQPAVRWRVWLLFGLALGLTVSVRVGGLLALVYLVLAIGLRLGLLARAGAPGPALARDALRSATGLLTALLVAYAVMGALWPWALQSPLNPWRAFTMFSRFPFDGTVLFQGKLIPANALPASYLPALLALTQPELSLIGLAGAVVLGIVTLRRQPHVLLTRQGLRVALVAFSAVFPVLYFVVARPVAYNGMRHFLFVLPPITVLAALALERAWQMASAASARVAIGVALVVGLVVQLRALVTLHPEQYVYFNSLAGGTRGAQGRYELDYWGTSLAEAAHRLTGELARRGEQPRPGQPPFKVYVCGNVWSAALFFPAWLTPTERSDQADFMVGIAQFYCQTPADSRRIVAVERAGALLSFADDLRGRAAARSAALHHSQQKQGAEHFVPTELGARGDFAHGRPRGRLLLEGSCRVDHALQVGLRTATRTGGDLAPVDFELQEDRLDLLGRHAERTERVADLVQADLRGVLGQQAIDHGLQRGAKGHGRR